MGLCLDWEDSEVPAPSLRHAKKLVPPPFVEVWKWFMEHEGDELPKLPHRMEPKIRVAGIPISRDSGIFWPGKEWVTYQDDRLFALTIHNSNKSSYCDLPPINLGDGTWLFKYCRHEQAGNRGEAKGQSYNDNLLNCLDCGVPVGVFYASADGGYRVMGLAYVEHYDSGTGTFVLHGPVRPDGEQKGLFAPHVEAAAENEGNPTIQGEQDSPLLLVRRRVREGQRAFRKRLLTAYQGSCAITGVAVEQALQAAHIENYRGPRSQTANNGVLLRADVHLLFDAHLLTFDLLKGKPILSSQLAGTPYEYLADAVFRLPKDKRAWPDERLMESHNAEFRYQEHERHSMEAHKS